MLVRREQHVDAFFLEFDAIGLERAATFLASSSRNFGQIRAVYACGGGSRVPGLLPWLSDRLRIPVQPANALAKLAVRDGALEFLSTDEVAPLLMLPVVRCPSSARVSRDSASSEYFTSKRWTSLVSSWSVSVAVRMLPRLS